MMDLSGLSSYIDLILSNEDVKESKPNPEIYLKAIKHFDVKPNECLILEDNEHGIKAALESGGNLMKITEPSDVTWQAINSKIESLNT